MNMIESVKNLGLKDKEAKIYIALLQLGQATAYVIADRANIKKPTTYVILEELIEKGFVTKVPRTRKKLYSAKSPNEIFNSAEEKLNITKKILPELMAMAMANSNSNNKSRTIFYEGLAGIKQAVYYRLKEMKNSEIVGFYATAENLSPELINLIDEWLIFADSKYNVHIRGIAPGHPSLVDYREYKDKKFGSRIKEIPYSDYSSKISIEAGDTFVRIIMLKQEQAIIIENPDFANVVKQLFEIVSKRYEVKAKD
ncbi:MAG: helix-turn-helix domain-containing protein [Candidatus Taylorbacteria bacterium]|nr:helix-turn-helix domain-containing protein [Candidatus Taylorbacteria bacterium]